MYLEDINSNNSNTIVSIKKVRWTRCCRSIIPDSQQVWTEELQVQGQPGQFEILSENAKVHKRAGIHSSVVMCEAIGTTPSIYIYQY